MQHRLPLTLGVVSFILINLSLQPLSACQDSEDQGPKSGFLYLKSASKRVAVSIDGEFRGLTPLPVQSLPTGVHEVEVSHPQRTNWLDQDWRREVHISAGDTLTVEVVFSLSYSINSIPYHATVMVDGEPDGLTPIFVRLPEGHASEVSLSKIGYEDSTFSIGLTQNRFFQIRLKSETLSANSALPEAIRPAPKKLNKTRLYAALGLTAISGSLALYFRNKGNVNHDRYLETGNPQAFNRFYDDAKRFDRYAAVSFGVSQVSLIYSFYLLIKRTNL